MAQTQSSPITFDDLKRETPSGIYIMTISPEQARRIARQTVNSEVNFRRLENESARTRSMIESMSKGLWRWTDADPIRLQLDEKTGEIVATDGQTRLYCAGVARRVLKTIVLWGPEWTSGLWVDRNKMRNAGQYLAHEHGIKNATFVSVARFHLARIRAHRVGSKTGYQATLLNDEEIIDEVLNNENELRWAIARVTAATSRGLNSVAYATFLYEALSISPELAAQFHEDMKDNDLEPVDPLAQMRRMFARRFAETTQRASKTATMDNLVKAWDMRAKSETVSKWFNAITSEVTFPSGYKLPEPEQAT